jgi:hypothetical protein
VVTPSAVRVSEWIVIPPFGKMFPPDPPEKWRAFESAAQDADRTKRMIKLVIINYVPLILAIVAIVLLVLFR